jgi:hypothetical protein
MVCIGIVGFALLVNAWGQSTGNPYQSEVDEAEAKAKIAKAKKEELEAKFPAPDASLLKGTAKVEGSAIETKIQAYKAMKTGVENVADEIAKLGIRKLYKFNEDEFGKIIAYKKIIQQFDLINGEYKNCFEDNEVRDGVAPGLLAGIILKWLPLLKTDVALASADIDIDQDALLAQFAASLRDHGVSLSNPYVSSLDFATINSLNDSTLIDKLRSAEEYRSLPGACSNSGYEGFKPRIDTLFKKLEEDLGLVTKATKPETKVTTKTTTDRPPTVTVVEKIENTPAQLSVTTSNNLSLWDLVKIENLIGGMANDRALWIRIKSVKAGGNVRTKTNPLIDIFRGGSEIKFSGGTILSFVVLNNDGGIVTSNVVSTYRKYQGSKSIRKY